MPDRPITFLLPPSLGEFRASARADLLESWFAERFGVPVKAVVAMSYGELEARLVRGDAELAWAPPALCAAALRRGRTVLRAVRAGRSAFRAALLARAHESTTLDALEGLRAAWVDPLSAAGYLLPVAHIRRHGREPGKTFSEETFHGSFHQALLAVVSGAADVTSIHTPRPALDAATTAVETCVGSLAAHLAPFAYTDEVPHDGLVLPEGAGHLRDRLRPYVESPDRPNLLLSVLDADSLEPAAVGDYAAIEELVR